MLIRTWASEYGIPFAAVLELERRIGLHGTALDELTPKVDPSDKNAEAKQQQLIRFDGAAHGCKLYRNNVGALRDDRGIPVRYGLCNDTPALNKKFKSSDLIGWRKTLVEPAMVGQYVAITVMRECKPEGWIYVGTEREQAQLNFIELAIADGCDASFATGPGSFASI